MSSNSKENIPDLFNSAKALFLANRYVESIELFKVLLKNSKYSTAARSYLADCYRHIGEFNNAIPLYNELLNSDATNHQIKVNLFVCLRMSLPTKYTVALENDVICYLSFNNVNHNDLSNYVSELIMLKYDLVSGSQSIDFDAISKDRLVKIALHRVILTNEYVEMFLTGVRKALLSEMLNSSNVQIDSIDLAISIAAQQFNCEYTYIEDEQEVASVNQLVELLRSLLSQQNVSIDSLLAPVILLAMYLPLYKLEAAERLLKVGLNDWPELVRGLINQNIHLPQQEMVLMDTISELSAINNPVSSAVKQQYEDHPYPRWSAASYASSDNYGRDMERVLSKYQAPDSLKTKNLNILIAGCGTGKQVIEVAKSYPSASILAVDLSKRSLAYAKLKSMEYQVSNVEFISADILELGELNQTFDIIESIGVLHHMSDPAKGLSILNQLLSENGVLKIGLYSKRARAPISDARRKIQQDNTETTVNEIRAFRKEAMMGGFGEEVRKLACYSVDFYSISGCRDLFFHVQEHLFDCIEMKQMLDQQQLEFLGFSHIASEIRQAYQNLATSDSSMADLEIWEQAEKQVPNAFGQMYQFWCCKKR